MPLFTASELRFSPEKTKFISSTILDIDMNLSNIAHKAKHTAAGSAGVMRLKISVSISLLAAQ